MAKLDIGGCVVEVGDEFLRLSPTEQSAAVEEIAASLPKARPAGPAPSGADLALASMGGAFSGFGDTGSTPEAMNAPARGADDAARSLANSLTAGLADKAAAALSPGGYADNLQAERSRSDTVDPGLRYPAEIAGALTTGACAVRAGLTLAPAVAGRGLIPKAGAFGLEGMAWGGL